MRGDESHRGGEPPVLCAMTEMRPKLKIFAGIDVSDAAAHGPRVGYVEGAIGGPERTISLAALFPQVDFVSVGATWPDRPAFDIRILIVGAEPAGIDDALARLATTPKGLSVIVALRDADVTTTRRLLHAGAADIVPAPVSEAALALSLERLLASGTVTGPNAAGGRVITFMKAGGGVGATAIATQLATILAGRGEGGVCLADLDLQFGQAALYLDLGDALSVTDILGGGGPLEEAPLATAIATHRGGTRLLAAPRELTPLETLGPDDIDGLFKAMRRDFAISLVDLPSAWTAWTNRALQISDGIVLVTRLSVPHIDLVKRQLRALGAQRLDTVPLTLVCNQVNAEQQAIVSVKAAEKAIGRDFDVVIPEERRLMDESIAQGCEISAIRRGSKLEKAIVELAGKLAPVAVATDQPRRRWR